MRWLVLISAIVGLATATTGCGGSSGSVASTQTTTTTQTVASPPPQTTTSSGPGALQAEANAAAAGDIPDNQVFLVFSNRSGGYSMKYPEGWAQQGAGRHVVFRDKNNIARIEITAGGPATTAKIKQALSQLAGVQLVSPPVAVHLPSGRALKVVYSTRSAANAVTGKRVTLVVDRYYLTRGGRQAIVDLGSPKGVDNVDAYRLMVESFRWK